MLLNDFIRDILTGIYKDWGNHKTFKIFASTIAIGLTNIIVMSSVIPNDAITYNEIKENKIKEKESK